MSSSEDVQATGYDESKRFLKIFEGTLDDRMISFLDRIGETIVANAKSNLQNLSHIMTGNLLASIKILDRDPGGKWIEVGSEEFYASIIEHGRGPVFPISAKVLHWKDKNGNDVFARYSGPVQPSPFMEPAVIEATHNAKGIFLENETTSIREML